MFFEIGGSQKFRNIRRKTPVSLFLIKLQAWRPVILLKRDSNTGVFLRILQNFRTVFYRTPLVAASEKDCSLTLKYPLSIAVKFFLIVL